MNWLEDVRAAKVARERAQREADAQAVADRCTIWANAWASAERYDEMITRNLSDLARLNWGEEFEITRSWTEFSPVLDPNQWPASWFASHGQFYFSIHLCFDREGFAIPMTEDDIREELRRLHMEGPTRREPIIRYGGDKRRE